ncbi:MAG: MgtC/SapB family protein [Chloroflexota bacterium]|nr:MgtC/SapB family protein [Chloroflexota bacterium]
MADLTFVGEAELVGRIVLSAVLGGVLGWERQLGQQPAGLRTHMLVSIGAAAYTLAGTVGVTGLGTAQDPGRVAAQIVTGIGFIGAGTIWRSTGNDRVIRGLTTAASIWVAASIGMLCGFGLYVLAAGCAVVSFVVLRLLRGLERLPGALWSRVTPRMARPAPATLHEEPAPSGAPPAGELETVGPAGDDTPDGRLAPRADLAGADLADTTPPRQTTARASATRRARKKDRGKKDGGGKKDGKRGRRTASAADQPDHIADD